MDQRQKNLLTSNAQKLADSIKFEEFADHLLLRKLVTKKEVEEIVATAEYTYTRNVKLLNALQDSESHLAFDEFVQFLELTKNVEALKLISPKSLMKKTIFIEMAEKLNPFSNKDRKYSLGMDSGSSSSATPSYSTTDTSTSYHCGSASPLKEMHRATLICPSNSSFQLPRKNPEPLKRASTSTASLNAPPSSSYQSNNRCDFRACGSNLSHNSHYSQTPNRPQELNLIDNLSINDSEDDKQNQEPVVCWHPYEQTGNQEGVRASSPHYCHPSYSSSASSSSDSSSDSIIIDPNLILDPNVTMAIAREGPKLMKVKMATVCHNNFEEDYKMTSRPRGPCLIVNNIDFEAEIFPTRKGSDEDARRFDEIFQQLGFDVIMTRNQTAGQMRKLFKDVAAKCKPEHDALFVFILSHGSEHGIYGTDGMEVYLESEIISCFDNRNCKAMLGKPKVFVIQACRGRAKDCGGEGDVLDSIACSPVLSPSVLETSQGNRVPASWLPSSQPQDGKKRKHPIRTDMLLIFSCLAGFVSVRNELAGSWLGVALAYFVMTHAHEKDLLNILYKVTHDVLQRESSHGHIQSIELKLLGWTKNLYFNPGIYL